MFGAGLAFALLIDRGGILIASVGAILGAALADRTSRWHEVAALAVVAMAFGAIVFVMLLGLNIPLHQSSDRPELSKEPRCFYIASPREAAAPSVRRNAGAENMTVKICNPLPTGGGDVEVRHRTFPWVSEPPYRPADSIREFPF